MKRPARGVVPYAFVCAALQTATGLVWGAENPTPAASAQRSATPAASAQGNATPAASAQGSATAAPAAHGPPAATSETPPAAPTRPAPEAAQPAVESSVDADSDADAPSDRQGAQLRQQVTAALRGAAVDLELPVALILETSASEVDPRTLRDAAQNGWALGARLQAAEVGWTLSLSAVAPGSAVLAIHRVETPAEDLELRTIALLKGMTHAVGSHAPTPHSAAEPKAAEVTKLSDQQLTGRAVLAAYGATAGGYFGYAINSFGGASDSQLVFPLMTLGAGAGLGAALVVAEEWELDDVEARYLWAAGAWPGVGALLLTSGLNDDGHVEHGWGLAGTAAGLALGSVGLSLGELRQGGDALTHSGAVYGALLGGLGELFARGTTETVPKLGLGIGMLAGVGAVGAVAPWLPDVSLSRVMFADLSASLGALAGAAIASPLLVGDSRSALESRIWLSSTALGAVTGGVLGFVLADDAKPDLSALVPADVHLSFGQQEGVIPGTRHPYALLSGRF